MTIASLEMEYFEGHENTLMEFSPGLNVITGLSGHGKSSIIRAFRWNTQNNIKGDPMLCHFRGDEETASTVTFNDGSWSARIRGDDFNGYEISTEEDPFSALRGKIPEQVEALCNMDMDSNIHKQSDFYFMLLKSPGEVARMFNKISGLEEMDVATKQANALYTEHDTKYNIASKRYDALEVDLKELEWVPKADKAYQEIEGIEEQIASVAEECNAVEAIVTKMEEIDVELGTLLPYSLMERIEEIFDIEKKWFKVTDELAKLEKLLESILSIDLQLKDITLPDTSLINEIDAVLLELSQLEQEYDSLVSLIDYIEDTISDISILDERILHGKLEVKECIRTSGICPACEGSGMRGSA